MQKNSRKERDVEKENAYRWMKNEKIDIMKRLVVSLCD